MKLLMNHVSIISTSFEVPYTSFLLTIHFSIPFDLTLKQDYNMKSSLIALIFVANFVNIYGYGERILFDDPAGIAQKYLEEKQLFGKTIFFKYAYL